MAQEILEILIQFGGNRSGQVAVRFLLPAFFWAVLAFVALRECRQNRERKDCYIGFAAVTGLARELLMFTAEHGSSRGLISFNGLYSFYPPFEHAATMLSSTFIAAAFINYLLAWQRFSRRYLISAASMTLIIYAFTAVLWPIFLRDHPGALFGSFWGDMVYRVSASILIATALLAFLYGRHQGARIHNALLLGFAFLFLDEFLMILNLATGERYIAIYAPIRHNLHIWAIPLFLGVYWSDLKHRLNKALENFRQERSRSEAIIAAIGDGISIQDADFRIVYQNNIHKELMGDHLDELCYQAYAKKAAVCEGCPVARTLQDGVICRAERRLQVGQEPRHMEVTASPLKDSAGRIIAGIEVVRDITERKRWQEEVAKSQKLESVGLLAGGLAHDFNNLLTGIYGNINLAKLSINDGHKAHERLSEAERASLRAADLTRQLLTFSKGGAPVKKTESIMEIIRESVGFTLSGSNVRAEFIAEDNIDPVEVDAGQMNQVFNNLALNAVQAMPNGGNLKVSITNFALTDPAVLPLPVGNYVRMSVSDTGIGMPEELLPKIFDPYFTTKQKGNGLGLATVYSIMKKHDGCVTVESKPGRGTTFHLYLPTSKSTLASNRVRNDAIIAGKGKILFMDDEEAVRNIAGEMLKELGFEYVFAVDGAEAIGLYQQARDGGKAFDLVIMDLTIPGGTGGKEAIRKLLDLDPHAVAIVSSGYSNDPVMADYRRYGFQGVITKPYNIESLGTELHRVLVQ